MEPKVRCLRLVLIVRSSSCHAPRTHSPAPSPHGVAALTIRAGRGHKPEKGATYFDGDWDNTINKAGLFPDTSIHLASSDTPPFLDLSLPDLSSFRRVSILRYYNRVSHSRAGPILVGSFLWRRKAPFPSSRS
jgi:hypothetical protein